MHETLTKPQPDANGNYHYGEFIRYLEQKYGCKAEATWEEDSHFEKWADARGYTKRKRDPEGKYRSSSQIWYREYQNDPEGAAARPKQKSFRLWLCWLGSAFLSPVVPKTPLRLNMGLLLDRWNENAAPVFQKAVELGRLRMTNKVQEMVDAGQLPAEYQRQLELQYLELLPDNAYLPDYVRTILEYARAEFGDMPLVSFADENVTAA